MSINLIGGIAKGFKIKTIDSDGTRPTSIMLKRKIFDAFQNLDNYEFYDLCAGSGSIGLEAASRGASSLVMCEKDPRAYKTLKSNVLEFKKTYNLNNITTEKADFLKTLKNIEINLNREYFIFFDPPYERVDMYESFINYIDSIDFNGVVVIEACRQKTISVDEFEKKFKQFDKVYKQGTSYFGLFYKRVENEA